MKVWAAIGHLVELHGLPFVGGLAAGIFVVLLFRLGWLRTVVAVVLLLLLLAISVDAAFAADLFRPVPGLLQRLLKVPAVASGALLGGAVTGLVLWRTAGRKAATLPHEAPRLRLVLAVVLVVVIKLVGPQALDLLANTNTPWWNLPDERLTRQVVSNCQIYHQPGAAGPVETLLCPQAIGGDGFADPLRQAIVAAEDRNFFYHGSLDVHGMVRAFRASTGGTLEGASTITQQVARILFLDRDAPDRKLLEWVMAQRIFDVASQAEILDIYLNVATLPHNLHGFDAAARYYFGVSAGDLDLAESALLAGMLPSPKYRDIASDGDAVATGRRRHAALDAAERTLASMVAANFVSSADARAAVSELKRKIGTGKFRRGDLNVQPVDMRPYRDEALAEAAMSHVALGDEYRLVLGVDPALQQSVAAATTRMAGDHQGAGILVATDGVVLAVAGGRSYAGSFNRATDVGRSVGSAAKLLPLIAATESGITLASTLSAKPWTADGWPAEPEPACVVARMPLKLALQHSCNRPFVRLADTYSPRVDALMSAFGFTWPHTPVTMPVGGLETSPALLARAYATVANGGMLPTLHYLVAALSPRGSVIFSPTPTSPVRVMDSVVAKKVLADLRIPVASGTATAANSRLVTVYGKTGTSNDATDSVFVGIVPDGFTGAFWLGNERPTAIAGAHGGGAPAAAFRQVVDAHYAPAPPAKAASVDPSWLDAQAWLRAAIQYAAALGFAAIVAGWIVGAIARRTRPDPDAGPQLDPRPSGPWGPGTRG